MKEKEIREMLNGIINNGEKWEYRKVVTTVAFGTVLYTNWKPYKLGDEIYENWEYRKVKIWYVEKDKFGDVFINFESHQQNELLFKGTMEECEKFIKEPTKKTWLEEQLSFYTKNYSKDSSELLQEGYEDCAYDVCKKILEEVRTHEGIEQMTKHYIGEIIKNLGVKV